MLEVNKIPVPGLRTPFPVRCECPDCGREGCSGDCDWSGPPESSSGAPDPEPSFYDDDDDDDDSSTSSSSSDTSSSTDDPFATYEERVQEALTAVMDGDDD